MNEKRYLMTLDAGSGGAKCFICDTDGMGVVTFFKEWNRSTWKPDVGWQIFSEVIREALTKGGVSPNQIAGVSSTSMREEIVLLDKNDKDITLNPGKEIIPHGLELGEMYGEEIYKTSGHWPTPGFMPVSKLVWLRDYAPQTLSKVKTLLMINDWILYKLTGKSTTEPSGACETCLFDISKGEWSEKLIDELKLPSDIFPPIYKNGQVMGEVSEEASTQTHLKEGTLVIVGGADTQCGLIGTTSVKERKTTAVAGTTTPVQMVLSKPIFDAKCRTWTNCHAVPGKWILESNAGSTGWIYRWFRDNFAECENTVSKSTGIDTYDLINKIVENTSLGSNGLMAFLGCRIFNVKQTSMIRTRAPGTLVGIQVRPGPGAVGRKDLARSIVESICYAVRGNCEQIEEISKIKIRELNFCGGNSKSKIWAQIQADVLGIPVKVPMIKDATALGAAILASVGSGIYRDIPESSEKMVHWEAVYKPENYDKYDELYHKWRKLYQKMLELN